MVEAGTEYKIGDKLLDDPKCLGELHKHVCLAHYLKERESQLEKPEFKRIIKAEGDEWPREFIKKAKENRDEDAIIKSKLLKFADEAAFEPDLNVFDD